MIPANLLFPLPQPAPQEIVDTLASSDAVRIERIVSNGQRSPDGFWYDQPEDEWVLLLAGAAHLGFADGRRQILAPGDHIHIPAGQRHRVEWTAPDMATVWLAVFYRPGPGSGSGPAPATSTG